MSTFIFYHPSTVDWDEVRRITNAGHTVMLMSELPPTHLGDVDNGELTLDRAVFAWDQAVQTNRVLNREIGQSDDLLRCAREALTNAHPLYARIDAWLNRGW